MFMAGTIGGWSSPYLARLTAEDSPIPLTPEQASWVASLMNLGRIVGGIPGAISANYIGSKKTLLYNGIPLILSWVSYIVADSVAWLYVGRIIGGFSIVIIYGSFPVYLGEISSPGTRGALVTYATLGSSIGTVFGNVIGTYVSVAVFAWISLVPTVMAILIFMWVPDSPYYLIGVGKMEEAKKAIARYNPDVDVEVEAKSIQDFVNASKASTLRDTLREFNIPANRKAGIIIVSLHMFAQLCGLNSVFFYLEIIFKDAGLTVVLPSTMVIVAGVGGIFAAVAAVYLTDKLGRRLLWNVSTFGIALTMVALATNFALLDAGFDSTNLQWLVILIILVYETFVFIGIFPVPNTILSELFAPRIKGLASCMATTSIGIFAFISSRTYQPLIDATNAATVYGLYAAIGILAMIFGLTFLPETKGKSLQEIQNILHKKNPA